MTRMPTAHDRALELLADRAVDALDTASQSELDDILATLPQLDDDGMEMAAAAMHVALSGVTVEPMPAHLRSRLANALPPPPDAGLPSGFEAKQRLRLVSDEQPPARRGLSLTWAGWLAAAAVIVLAAFFALRPQDTLSAEEARARLLANASDIATAQWTDWDDPEQSGVSGVVEWSEAAQRGFMTFEGLKTNDPSEEQYQLWIIDERGMDQRISGAVFNASESGETIVEIEPGIEVHNAAAFAVTIERPGGTWVSDMSRRVVIAGLQE